MKTARPTNFWNFWLGFFFHASVMMTFQDWFGLERWQAYEKAGWINTPWWIGAGCAVLCLIELERISRRAKE